MVMDIMYDDSVKPTADEVAVAAEFREDYGFEGSANYMVFRKNQEPVRYSEKPCHGALNDFDEEDGGIPTLIYSTSRPNTTRNDRTFYLNWLFNESPLRYAFIDATVEEALSTGVWVRTDIPSNLMVAALIASRYIWCNDYIVERMYKLNKEGLSTNMSFILSHTFYVTNRCSNEDAYRTVEYGAEEWVINPRHVDKEMLTNFFNEKIKNINSDFCDDSNYKGIFGLWSGDEDDKDSEEAYSVRPIIKDIPCEKSTTYEYAGWRYTEQREASTFTDVVNWGKQLEAEIANGLINSNYPRDLKG